MNNPKYNIVLLEPSAIIQQGLIKLVTEREPGFIFHVINDIQGISSLSNKFDPAIVIVAANIAQNYYRQISVLRKEMAQTKWVVLLYQYLNPSVAQQFDDYISIDHTPDDILAILNHVIMVGSESGSNNKSDTLSEREIDVLKLLVTGFSGKEIADRLNISINTVTSHRKNISQKTGIKSLAGLTIYAVTNHVVTMASLQK